MSRTCLWRRFCGRFPRCGRGRKAPNRGSRPRRWWPGGSPSRVRRRVLTMPVRAVLHQVRPVKEHHAGAAFPRGADLGDATGDNFFRAGGQRAGRGGGVVTTSVSTRLRLSRSASGKDAEPFQVQRFGEVIHACRAKPRPLMDANKHENYTLTLTLSRPTGEGKQMGFWYFFQDGVAIDVIFLSTCPNILPLPSDGRGPG